MPAWGFSAFDNLEFGEGYQIKMLEEVADFLFCETVIGYNPSMIIGCTDRAATNYNADENTDDGSCEFEPDYLLIGSWDMHSMYDLNLITGEWESVDLEDVGGADNIAFDADSISWPDYDVSYSYDVIGNSNELQIDLGEEVGDEGEEIEILSWIYSFGNEHALVLEKMAIIYS